MRRPRPAHRPVVAVAAAALSASLLDARPILLPFLYPALSQQQNDPRGGVSSSTRRRRSSGRSTSGSTSYSNPAADRLPQPFSIDNGQYQPRCWQLLGLSNCPRDNDEGNGDGGPAGSAGLLDLGQGGIVVDDSIDLDLASNFSSASLTPTPTPTSIAPSTTSPTGTITVKLHTMTFQVTNIPSGWQRNSRTHFYSKGMIIGFSVTLAILIILFIVGCVIWRVKAARVRRDCERALARKKAQIAMGLAEAADGESAGYSTEDEEEREATRQRGIRRRRQNVRAERHAVQEKGSLTTFGSTSTTRRLWPRKWRGRRRRIPKNMSTEEQEKLEEAALVETCLHANAAASEAPNVSTSSESRLQPCTVPPIPSPSDPSSTPGLSPPTHLARLSSPPSLAPVVAPDVHPPAYRRGTFGRSRLSTAPITAPSRTGKERELAFDTPEEYLRLAGVLPPPIDDTLVPATPAIQPSTPPSNSQQVGYNGDEDMVDEEDEDGVMPREDVTAHLATDDKAVLQRLGQIPSAPPQPASPSFPATAPRLTDVEEEGLLYDDERHAGPSCAHALLPVPPPITSAHLFIPPSTMDLPEYAGSSSTPVPPEKQSELEVIPSAPPVASAPPLDDEALAPSAPPLEPSSPLLHNEASAPTYVP